MFRVVARGIPDPGDAEAYILGVAEKPDEPRYWLLIHRRGEILGYYRVEYTIWSRYADVVSDERDRLRCPRCGAAVRRVEIHRDAYGVCERGHMFFLGILVGRVVGFEEAHGQTV